MRVCVCEREREGFEREIGGNKLMKETSTEDKRWC